MSLVHDLVPCGQCRLTFTSEFGLRHHELLDHTPARDGAALTALLVAPPDQSPEPARPGPQDPTGTRARRLLSGAACLALTLTGWLLLLALFVATRA